MKLLPLLMAALPLAAVAQSQSSGTPGVMTPKITGVLAILSAKQGVTPQQVMPVMPAELRATIKLYLDGIIRQWYSKGDGKGVVFFLDVATVDEAHAIVD